MELHVGFSGWFQCRLATDPDPFDEPRGVTGWTFAQPGEPDLDRVVRFQPEGVTARLGCEPMAVGVVVDRVTLGESLQAGHELLGAPVRLAAQEGRPPVFEGRNGAVADDSIEPIVPLLPMVGDGDRRFGRAAAAGYSFPYAGLRGRAGVPGGPGAPTLVQTATGITDITSVWRARLAALRAATPAGPVERAAVDARIDGIRNGTGLGLFNVALMSWAAELRGPVELGAAAPLASPPVTTVPWSWRLWMGGWDADALGGFAVGELTVPLSSSSTAAPTADWWHRSPPAPDG